MTTSVDLSLEPPQLPKIISTNPSRTCKITAKVISTGKRDRVEAAILLARETMVMDHNDRAKLVAKKFLDGGIDRDTLYNELFAMRNEEFEFSESFATWNEAKRAKRVLRRST